jgi:hypothetical protein
MKDKSASKKRKGMWETYRSFRDSMSNSFICLWGKALLILRGIQAEQNRQYLRCIQPTNAWHFGCKAPFYPSSLCIWSYHREFQVLLKISSEVTVGFLFLFFFFLSFFVFCVPFYGTTSHDSVFINNQQPPTTARFSPLVNVREKEWAKRADLERQMPT